MEEEKPKKKKSSRSHKKKSSEHIKTSKDTEKSSEKTLSTTGQEKDVADNEGESSRKSNAGSPEGGCPICLGKLDNTSFTDSCFHQFCFTCLKEWTKVKPECPLCKQKYTSILFNVTSYEKYEQISVADIQSANQAENPHHRFRYRTTLTVERRLMLDFPDAARSHIEHDYTLMRPSRTTTTRTHWRRQRESATSDFRRNVYMNGLRALEFRDQRMRERDITPEFFTRNPATLHRLVPWLNRELNALLNNDNNNRQQFLMDFILGLIKTYPISSEEFYNHIYPYLGRRTRQFMHEFETFAKSPYNISAYDQNIVYEPQPIEVISAGESTEEEEEDNDDVIIIDQGGSSNDPIDLSEMDSPPQPPSQTPPPLPQEPYPDEPRQPPREPPAERRTSNTSNPDYTPILDRVRRFLEEPPPHPSSLPSAGWDSPIPGPSWMDTNSDSGGVQEIPLPTTPPVLSTDMASVTLSQEKDPLPPPKKKGGIPIFPPMLTELFNNAGKTAIKIENSDDSDESSIGSDVIFISIENPWEARPAVVLSSDEEGEQNNQHTSKTERKKDRLKHDDRNSTSSKRSRSRHERHHHRYEISSSRSRSRERSHAHHPKKRHKKHKSREYERYRSRSRSRERHGYHLEPNLYNYYDSRFYSSSRPSYEDEYYSRMSRPRLVDDRRDWDYGRSYSRVIEAEYDRPKKYAYRSSSEDSYSHRSKKSKKAKKHKKHKKHKKQHKATYISSDSDFDIIAVGRPKPAPVEAQERQDTAEKTSSSAIESGKYKKHPTGHKKKTSSTVPASSTSRETSVACGHAPTSPPDEGIIQEISEGNLCLSPISDGSTDSQMNLLHQPAVSEGSSSKPSTSQPHNKGQSPVNTSINNYLSDISDGASEEGEISDF